jgi:hypothetical protein
LTPDGGEGEERAASSFWARRQLICSGTSESLAGRIRHLELAPLAAGEIGRERLDALWLCGGFPESLLPAWSLSP